MEVSVCLKAAQLPKGARHSTAAFSHPEWLRHKKPIWTTSTLSYDPVTIIPAVVCLLLSFVNRHGPNIGVPSGTEEADVKALQGGVSRSSNHTSTAQLGARRSIESIDLSGYSEHLEVFQSGILTSPAIVDSDLGS
ncbi:hypothetical protein CSOJ01_10264 [Colletotrichum sojae]|uniref:Uncharacterized protein n=1 Tax=Colletotrichum sojae TaxID=2175907 RepID=A0A8H6MQD4_9PEZI|nr:hypothetical protein CSOJ01_10264 [Colletotrichum sojae]